MPRRSSAGRSSSRSAPRAAPLRNAPQPVHPAPPPATVQRGGSVIGGVGASIVDGMALGTGSAIAHRAVDAVIGPPTVQHEMVASSAPAAAAAAPLSGSGVPPSAPSDACSLHFKAFQDCINNYGNDISKCQFYMDMLNECRRGGGTGATVGA